MPQELGAAVAALADYFLELGAVQVQSIPFLGTHFRVDSERLFFVHGRISAK